MGSKNKNPANPVATLSTATSINDFAWFFIPIGIGIIDNSKAALLIDCLKLPSKPLIMTKTHNSGNVKKSNPPKAIPNGKISNVVETPNLVRILLVNNNWINNAITLKVENQKPKNEAKSSGFLKFLFAKSLNWKSTNLATSTLIPVIKAK